MPLEGKVKELSRGMGMKLSLACALSHEPKLLVLDEATAGLDPMMRDEVVGLIRDFMLQDEERAVLMSSHITSDLDKIADVVVCLGGGTCHLRCELHDCLQTLQCPRAVGGRKGAAGAASAPAAPDEVPGEGHARGVIIDAYVPE